MGGRRARAPDTRGVAPAAASPPLSARGTRHRMLIGVLPALLATATWFLFVTDTVPGTHSALHGFPLDDAWIHMVYARGLATEGGFHYNPGIPEAGMTSPLWVVMLAGVQRLPLRGDPDLLVIAAKVLALACGIAGAWALAALARALGLGTGTAAGAAALYAVDPALTFSRAAGMEVPLFTLLVLLALLLAVRGRVIGAGAAAGLSVLARPEGLVLFPVIAVLLLRRDLLRAPGAAARFSVGALAAAAPLLIEAAYCQYATGAPMPNTFYVKLVGAGSQFPHRLALGWTDYVHGNLPYFTLEAGTLLALVGATAMLRRAPRPGAAVLATGALLFCGTLYSREFAAGHFHYWERWLIPAFPVLLLAIAAGVAEVGGGLLALRAPRAAARPVPRSQRAAFVSVAVLLAGILLARLPASLLERAHLYAWNCRNVEDLDVRTGRWVDAHLPRDAVVATSDAGAIRYFGRRVTVDLTGLNDHRVRAALARHQGASLLAQTGVGWFTIFPFWYPELVAGLHLHPVEVLGTERYTICDAPQDTLIVYRWDRPAP